MCASALRYSETVLGSGNVAKKVGPQQKIWSFPMKWAGHVDFRPPVTEPIHH